MKTQDMNDDVDDATFKAMCDWFSDDEWDIQLMLSMDRVTTRKQVIELCRVLIDSPWYEGDE